MVEMIETGKSVALWAEMGLGKTITVLKALEDRIYDRCVMTKALILAPKLVAESTWPAEARKWDLDLRVVGIIGTPEERRAALKREGDVYVMCRNNLPWLADQYMAKKSGKWTWTEPWPFDVVVIDESSSFKNPSGVWFKTMARIARSGCQIIELTGTPSPRGLDDLWAQGYLLDRGERLTDGITKYRSRWLEPDKTIMQGGRPLVVSYKAKPGAYEEVMERMSDVAVSLRAEDWLKMPERIDNLIKIKIPMKEYRRMEQDAVVELSKAEITAGSAATIIGKLLQMANGSVYDEDRGVHRIHDQKHRALSEIEERPLLVFYNYQHDLPEGAVVLDDPAKVEAWNRGEIDVLWAHPASAGHGLNMQEGGSTVVWFGLPYNMEWYQQANARLYRQGQKHTVVIHHLIAEGTVDEAVVEALTRKIKLQDAVMDYVRYKL